MSAVVERLATAYQSEDECAAWLRVLGYHVDLHGARVWAETGHDIARLPLLLRYAPDLQVSTSGQAFFVEVVDGVGRPIKYRPLMLTKMQALDVWALLAPVMVIDWLNGTAWWHSSTWAHRVLADHATPKGGTPFVCLPIDGELPLEAMFGGTR